MSDDHAHAIPFNKNIKHLWLALGLTSIFLISEFIGGLFTGSLALISDAAHMLTDASALAISLAASYVAKRSADSKRTFGYYRFEILAAAFNAILLFILVFYILYKTILRLESSVAIQTTGMMLIGMLGLVINFISVRLLSTEKDHSLHIKGAYLEVWNDMLGSIGVIMGAIIIKYTGWLWIDSLIAIGIGLWILPRTWMLLKETLNILLEGVPEEIDLENLKKTMQNILGVIDIHELHVWVITSGKISLTAHIVVDSHQNCDDILSGIKKVLAEQFNISHTTLQHETMRCIPNENSCHII